MQDLLPQRDVSAAAEQRGAQPVGIAAVRAARELSGFSGTAGGCRTAGLVKKTLDGVKVLGNGEITKKLTVQAAAFSASAKEKIEAAGGKAEVV